MILATSIVEALLANTLTHGEMKRSLVHAFSEASSFAMAQAIRRLAVNVTDFTDDEKAILQKACTENNQIAGAFGVPEAIYKAFGRPPVLTAKEDDDIPF